MLLLLPMYAAFPSLHVFLTPGSQFLATHLPLFFVPSLVTLPLRALPGASDLAKLAITVLGGFVSSLWISSRVALSFSPKSSSSPPPPQPAGVDAPTKPVYSPDLLKILLVSTAALLSIPSPYAMR